MRDEQNNQNTGADAPRDYRAELAELRAEARQAADEIGADVAGLDEPTEADAVAFEAAGAAIIGAVDMGPDAPRADVVALDRDRYPEGRAFYFTHPSNGRRTLAALMSCPACGIGYLPPVDLEAEGITEGQQINTVIPCPECQARLMNRAARILARKLAEALAEELAAAELARAKAASAAKN